MIDPKKLSLSDVGRKVIFRDRNTGRDLPGTIFSFSFSRVDVLYEGTNLTIGTRPSDLRFEGESDKIVTNPY
jgi:hypothetical protein